ncbi:nucleotidyl transferase AbiEii/AbiGii toxin family protein [Streptomyces sp. 71268]|uniref:nucleotidyl transferase AbiEii/AbiGii toxin family protein n=1 Tax=Streptomyces sp. 71268 TaxID=3002640 RepID=UPI0023FA1114|nr:nucleotidyl transferase AbiEii/AbiGii toxin family protein [Streptomyces sp. 71268]WEV26377.1 nucleotidyl transferase AbiEii/AbiGii toxin family protein [Streptomyces sp. 71268]
MAGADGVRGTWTAADWAGLPTVDRHQLRSMGLALAAFDRALRGVNWHLKGSTALLGWLGPTARMPGDVDLAVPAGIGRELLRGAGLPPGPDGARVRLLRTEPVVFSSPGRAAVHRALVGVRHERGDDRVLLNVLLVPENRAARDARTAPLAFPADTGPVTVPAATLSRCLAQKLLRYARRREAGKINTRWADLADFLIAATSLRAPKLVLDELRRDVAVEFAAMGRDWPTTLPPPPLEWLDFWDAATFHAGWPFGRLPEAAARLAGFWEPVLEVPAEPYGPAGATVCGPAGATACGPARVWSPDAWEWGVGGGHPRIGA